MDQGRNLNLIPCSICGRNFAEDVLPRHQNICAKTAQKKRKVFDSSKQRVEGTELAQLAKKGSQPSKKTTVSQHRDVEKKSLQPSRKTLGGKKSWQVKHEEFIRTIREARKVTQAINSGKPLPPPPPPTFNPDYVQCDYCGRRFNVSAAERHIQFCKTQHERIPKGRGDSLAAQKQAVRVNYQPPSNKPRKPPQTTSYNNNKYSNHDNNVGGDDYEDAELNYNVNSKYKTNGINKKNSNYLNNKPMNGMISTAGRGVTSAGKNQNNRTPISGQVLRTGRTAETYTEARQLSAKQRANMPTSKKFPSSDSISPTYMNKPMYQQQQPHNNHQPYRSNNQLNSGDNRIVGRGRASAGRGVRTMASNMTQPAQSMTSTMKPGARVPSSSSHNTNLVAGRFCYECGAKFPTATSKFCCECGYPKGA